MSSDAFLGRGPATRGEELATNYIRDRLQAAGVEPGGPDGSWFQEVPLVKADIIGTPSFSFSINGQAIPLKQGEQIAVRASMQNVDRVNIQNAPLVFLGYGVHAPERNWDDFKGQDLRGKVGIVLINDPDFETGQGNMESLVRPARINTLSITATRGRHRTPAATTILLILAKDKSIISEFVGCPLT